MNKLWPGTAFLQQVEAVGMSYGSVSSDPNDIVSHWASSTGLTAVSKFKPHLPAQWAVGTHRNGPSRTEKVTSRMARPIRNSTQIRN